MGEQSSRKKRSRSKRIFIHIYGQRKRGIRNKRKENGNRFFRLRGK